MGRVRLALLTTLMFAALAALTPARTTTDPPSRPWLRGMNLTSYSTNGLALPAADAAIAALAARGATHVAIVLPFTVADRFSSQLERSGQTPSDAAVVHAAAQARAHGLAVWLKPHVDPADGSFRGELEPGDREAWWASYRGAIDGTARLAAAIEADGFVVGTELTSMSGDEDRWRALIAGVRRRLPRATLTYAANWVDSAETVRFWDALDLIGVDAYMPLLPDGPPDPGVEALVAAWQPYAQRLRALAERHGRSVLFTEVGYQSRLGAAAAPARATDAPVDEGVQARAYEAVFRVFAARWWFRGAFWWDWSAEELAEPGSYHPQGKQAEAVLERFHAATLDARGGPAAR